MSTLRIASSVFLILGINLITKQFFSGLLIGAAWLAFLQYLEEIKKLN